MGRHYECRKTQGDSLQNRYEQSVFHEKQAPIRDVHHVNQQPPHSDLFSATAPLQ